MTDFETLHPRASAGTFTDKAQSAAEVTLSARPHQGEEPSHVDEQLVALYTEAAPYITAIDRARQLLADLEREERDFERTGNRRYRWATPPEEQIKSAETRIELNRIKRDEVIARTEPLHDEFESRGGWSRFFVTTGSNPHVHSSRDCSTCYPTTQFGWLTDHSGMDEAEIVELAGDEACTVCFPSAPVADRSAPRQNRLETPEARVSREEREAAKAAREAKKAATAINAPDGGPIYDDYGHEFKTERAAEMALSDAIVKTASYEQHPWDRSWLRVAMSVEDALAHKRGLTIEELRAARRGKLDAKAKRDGLASLWALRAPRTFDRVDALRAERDEAIQRWESLSAIASPSAGDASDLASVAEEIELLSGKKRMRQ